MRINRRGVVATVIERRHWIAAALAATALLLPATVAAPAEAAKLRAAISLTAPSSAPYGTTMALTGRLWRYGTPFGIRSAQVYLQRSPHGAGRWGNVTYGFTNASGAYRFTVNVGSRFDYRVYYKGSAAFTPALSPVRSPVIAQRVLLDSIATTSHDTGAVRVTGRVFPTPPNGTLAYLQRWDTAARVWRGLASGRTSSGRVTIARTLPASYATYRLVVSPRASYAAGISAGKVFVNYVWRGAFHRPVAESGPNGTFYIYPANERPQRDLAQLSVNAGQSYEFGVDTNGCRRIHLSTGAGSMAAAMRLILHTNRLLDDDVLYADGVTKELSADLFEPEQVVRLQSTNWDNNGPGWFYAQFRVLCKN